MCLKKRLCLTIVYGFYDYAYRVEKKIVEKKIPGITGNV